MFLNKHIHTIIYIFSFSVVFSQHRSFVDKYEYRKKRHEVTIGLGASNCLTDLGGKFSAFPESNTNEKIAEGDGKQHKFLKSI